MKKISKTVIKKILPTRSKLSSKIDGGKVFIVAGGRGLYGAGILSALAATRSGAGYTHLMTDLTTFPWIKFPDFILHPVSLQELKKHKDCVIAIGPGLGMTKNKKSLLTFLIKNKIPKVVVDADALTMLSKMKVKSLPASWILTPHEGELARLLNVSSAEIKKNRLHYACVAQKKYDCIVLLKGAETIIATNNQIYEVSSGTKALAKAGSGDVLLGMIAAFYAQSFSGIEAALLGAFIHGYASKLWLEEGNDYLSMRPLDLIDKISSSIHQLRK